MKQVLLDAMEARKTGAVSASRVKVEDMPSPTAYISTVEPVSAPPYNTPANKVQVGGNHYAKLAIQPYEYCTANNIPYVESNIIKYVTRWRDKNGVEDLRKAMHSLQWLIEYTEKST